jgi:hypothetical protein
MKEYPILFSRSMVQAILEGCKTQTRRIINPQPTFSNKLGVAFLSTGQPVDYRVCPYGQEGDRLWVRESWRVASNWDSFAPRDIPEFVFNNGGVRYLADNPDDLNGKARVSIHMPRKASRIKLEIVNVGYERLHYMTPIDAIREGTNLDVDYNKIGDRYGSIPYPKKAFAQLWDSINAKRGLGWNVNPWVWVITFERVS